MKGKRACQIDQDESFPSADKKGGSKLNEIDVHMSAWPTEYGQGAMELVEERLGKREISP